MQEAFEAQYGEKIRCRMILVDTQHKATAIWEELRKNPGGFEKIAMEQSMDTASRSLGGLLGEPITRHAYPQTLSDAAFRQLVDGDPMTKTRATSRRTVRSPARSRSAKWSGSSSAASRSIPAVKGDNLKDERVRKQTYEMIYEVKLKETMGDILQELIKAAAIENQLTGTVKLANEEKDPEYGVDGDVKLMSNPPATKGAAKPVRSQARCPEVKNAAPPVGLAPDAVREFERIKSRPKSSSAASSDAATSSSSASPN